MARVARGRHSEDVFVTDSYDLFNTENLTDQEQSRLAKLAGLREAGIDPYPAQATRTVPG